MSVAKQASTAEDLYEMVEQLAPRERLRLVEKIAHGLARALEAPVDGAVAMTIEPVPEVPEIDDPLAIFEATFGSGEDLWASPEGREQLETMRGHV